MDRASKMKINKEIQALNDTLNKMDLIFIGHSIQKQQNTHSSQVLMEHSPGYIISWVTNQAFVNLRKLKSYQVSFPTLNAMKLDINYRKKSVKTTNTWRLHNKLLNIQRSLKKSKRKSKNT